MGKVEQPLAVLVLGIITKPTRKNGHHWDIQEDIMWSQKDDGLIYPVALCSDVFFWGSADAEEITVDTAKIFSLAMDDCEKTDEIVWASALYVARVRRMRPQGAMMQSFSEPLADLFRRVGPEREVGIGNPYPEVATDYKTAYNKRKWLIDHPEDQVQLDKDMAIAEEIKRSDKT